MVVSVLLFEARNFSSLELELLGTKQKPLEKECMLSATRPSPGQEVGNFPQDTSLKVYSKHTTICMCMCMYICRYMCTCNIQTSKSDQEIGLYAASFAGSGPP